MAGAAAAAAANKNAIASYERGLLVDEVDMYYGHVLGICEWWKVKLCPGQCDSDIQQNDRIGKQNKYTAFKSVPENM